MTDSDTFNPEQYWEQRLAERCDLTGVGRTGWGHSFNRWAYRVRGKVFERVIRESGVDPGAADILDIGAGTGFYINRWRRLGATSITGIDLTEAAVGELRHRFPSQVFHVADITAGPGPLDGSSFDCISMMDVLFHIVDDDKYAAALRTIASLLRDGGMFIFSEAMVDPAPLRLTHVVHRGAGVIEQMLADAGLKVTHRRPFLLLMNDPVEPGHWLLQRYWKTLGFAIRRVPLAGRMLPPLLYPAERIAVRACSHSPSTMLCIARRCG